MVGTSLTKECGEKMYIGAFQRMVWGDGEN